MSLEMFLVYGFITLFIIGFVGFMLYSVVIIISDSIRNHKIDKEILNSMNQTERRYHRFLKRIWNKSSDINLLRLGVWSMEDDIRIVI